jgi:hypothetical protein
MNRGRPRARDRRWGTKFGAWVSRFTVTRITNELNARGVGVQDKTVYSWVSATRFPRPPHAVALVTMSGGAISLDDVYRHSARCGGRPESSADASRGALAPEVASHVA